MKNKIAFILVLILVMLQIMPAYAAVATGSNASVATSSNADEMIMESDPVINDLEFTQQYNNLLMFSSVERLVENETCVPYAQVTDANGKWITNIRGTYAPAYSGSTYTCYQWPERTDGTQYTAVYYNITKASGYLPSAGTYGVKWQFGEVNIDHEFTQSNVQVFAYQNGVATESTNTKVTFSSSNGENYGSGNVEIGYKTSSVHLKTYLTGCNFLEVAVPNSNAYKFTFSAQSGATAVSPEISAGASDVNNVIADNTASMADTLKEIIVHISDQLAALWDQMYNYMHLPQLANDDKNTQSIIDTLTNGLSVEVENNDDNTQQIIQNQDDNTNTVVNGYDPSDGQKADKQLSDSFNGLAEKEDQIMDQISEPLDSFEFDNPISQYLDTFGIFGDFLQQLFVRSGEFQNVINLSFIMGIALMVIGLYRFKAGN